MGGRLTAENAEYAEGKKQQLQLYLSPEVN